MSGTIKKRRESASKPQKNSTNSPAAGKEKENKRNKNTIRKNRHKEDKTNLPNLLFLCQ
jgi:hypothetical protein